MDGAGKIAAERRRQIIQEGYTAAHDAQHANGELVYAAMCYADYAGSLHTRIPNEWPWDPSGWKLTGDRIRDLVKAGSLIAAEIDRLQAAQEAMVG